MNEDQDPELLPLDPEIEHTFRQRRRQQANQVGVMMMDAGKLAQAQDGAAAKEVHNAVLVVDDRGRAIRHCVVPLFNELNMGIIVGQFSGMPTEDHHLHLRLFMEVSDSFKLIRVNEDALSLKLFPYSLRDKDEESLLEAWERFKELLRRCPHHGIPHCIQMDTFYNGLNAHTRMVVDASANGAFLAKSYNEAYEILERIANNNYQWPTNRTSSGKRRVAGVHELDVITSLEAQVSSISNMLNTMNMGVNSAVAQHMAQVENVSCVYYCDTHTFDNFPSNPALMCYMGNNNNRGVNSNSYNPAWRQHPKFSCSNQGAASNNVNAPTRPAYPTSYVQSRPQQGESSKSLESLLKAHLVNNEAFMSKFDAYMVKTNAIIQSQAASLRNLENQAEQLANELRNRPQGSLPSDTKNPRNPGKEYCKAITLRSGKELEALTKNFVCEKEPSSIQNEAMVKGNQENSGVQKVDSVHDVAAFPQQIFSESSNFQQPPFPQRFQNKQQDN
ncbi:uncharacterized protein LOC133806042 [Humulus lupulus]|uniref:uncharacterized protein LOC133806042 n=1 Tax=Humulus lupulus TaxID=3486 RepID=UPI002B412EB4|nr:uncharacterized protein LOC133806042 [Humulus lupulus]